LPRMFLVLENVTRGAVYVQEVSIREDLGNGRYGPEIMTSPPQSTTIHPQKEAYALDKVVQLAERSGVYLKLVVMEKADDIYLKMEDERRIYNPRDNEDGFLWSWAFTK